MSGNRGDLSQQSDEIVDDTSLLARGGKGVASLAARNLISWSAAGSDEDQ